MPTRNKKYNVASPALLSNLAAAIKRAVIYPTARHGHFDVGFEILEEGAAPLIVHENDGHTSWRWRDFAAGIAEEQPEQTIRWFLRRHEAFERLEGIENEYQRERERIRMRLAASAAAPGARWEQGRYEEEPEPEPEPAA